MVIHEGVRLGNRLVGGGEPVYVIAELGINHGGDVGLATRMVEAAASAGADAVKLQTYRTEERVPSDSPIFDLLKEAELDRSAHEQLWSVSRDVGVDMLSTPFDTASVDLLDELGVVAFKVASFDIVNLRLLDYLAQRKKPLVISRGMAGTDEIDTAVKLVRERGSEVILLHCVSAYPLAPQDANLSVMDTLSDRYACPVGYSDHTLGVEVPVLAVARGAAVIEKHFTLDKNAPGPDHALSAEPDEMRRMIASIRETESILGSPEPRLLEAEDAIVPYRRPSSV